MTPWSIRFASWGEFLEHAETAPAHKAWDERSSRGMNRSEFHGTDTFEEAMHLARYGWPDGEESIRAQTRSLVDKIASRIARVDYAYDVEGTELDVGTYLTGRPECWLREEHTLVDGPAVKHVRVVLNTGLSMDIGAAAYKARGTAVAAAVILLERAGCRVTVDAVSTCSANDQGPTVATIEVRVKDADQQLDEGRLAFITTHRAFHRRLMFSVRETCTNRDVVKAIQDSYGCPTNPTFDCDVYMPSMRGSDSHDWNDAASTERWIIETLRQQGVSVEGV